MAWTRKQAANDLERFLLRGEEPAIGAVELAVSELRNAERTCNYVWDEKHHALVCDQCGGTVPHFNDDINYCCDCGAKVVGYVWDGKRYICLEEMYTEVQE